MPFSHAFFGRFKGFKLGLSLRLCPYIVCASSEGYGETAHINNWQYYREYIFRLMMTMYMCVSYIFVTNLQQNKE